jgi:hypothetical protein
MGKYLQTKTHPEAKSLPVRGVDISARFHPDVSLFENDSIVPREVVPFRPIRQGSFSAPIGVILSLLRGAEEHVLHD